MATPLQVPIFVLAGQSNVAFGGIDNRLYELASAVGSNFDMVKLARGGTSLFAQVGPDWDPASGELYTQLIDAVEAAEAKVVAGGFEPVVYTLWVQGEADHDNVQYGDQLTKFIEQYRTDIGQPDASFAIALYPYENVVRSDQIAVGKALPHVLTIDPRDLKTWDGVHYAKTTRDHIAEDYFSALGSIIPAGTDYKSGLDVATIVKDGPLFRVTGPQFVDYHYREMSGPVSIHTASGDDVITTGAFNDTIQTGDNNDVVKSGAGNDYIDLGTHDDLAYAGAGDDAVIGREGTDRIYGQDGNDWLRGLDQGDFVYGGNGNDRVDGGNGNDYIKGDAGDDTVTGGAGRDTLFGGAGKDTFVFTATDFATGASANLDKIADFKSAEGDIIDLSGIDANVPNGPADDAFVYIGTAKFSKHAGELRLSVTSGGSYLYGDINGDGRADVMIKLALVTTLDAHDIVL